ncbi:hypothetical protein CONPUDRAFT_81567 [Coniophora puteana RWD-64-598 SS2]|uniref:Uncharacterized protein n=1 Tax=Coniophora puteana (strain RWD-64-598) TaxID=741705 RepID=A0A5M3MTD0_CONPW|nr:uncharacterized protein CONPUDRAFT_81567 [Coniophora puteana RWD-64-598 SS2]EIW81915.1 hypothetical protein CONPUDRAFT_81567 [Coniophora puteana RWD-64-598 SS2]
MKGYAVRLLAVIRTAGDTLLRARHSIVEALVADVGRQILDPSSEPLQAAAEPAYERLPARAGKREK